MRLSHISKVSWLSLCLLLYFADKLEHGEVLKQKSPSVAETKSFCDSMRTTGSCQVTYTVYLAISLPAHVLCTSLSLLENYIKLSAIVEL